MPPTRQSVTLRFSSRVENYINHRPSYPHGVIETLVTECGLAEKSVVADIGSGTGMLAELFLKNGNRVFAVEPNREMREAGERLLKKYPRFTSIEGTAEATTLTDRSIDFVTAGQAFHWFDRQQARSEFSRILKLGGWVALVWNERQTEASLFLRAYEDLLHNYGTDYEAVDHRHVDRSTIAAFFAPHPLELRRFANQQVLDFDGVRGRLLSSSYTPEPGHPNYQPMIEALRAIFEKYQVGSKVTFEYVTLLYYSHLV